MNRELPLGQCKRSLDSNFSHTTFCNGGKLLDNVSSWTKCVCPFVSNSRIVVEDLCHFIGKCLVLSFIHSIQGIQTLKAFVSRSYVRVTINVWNICSHNHSSLSTQKPQFIQLFRVAFYSIFSYRKSRVWHFNCVQFQCGWIESPSHLLPSFWILWLFYSCKR